MPKNSFALEAGGPKRLEVSWSGMWKNIQVALDGQPVGSIPDKAALEQGAEFALPDASRLRVQLVRSGMAVELQVTRDGQPLPGSAADPMERVKAAAYILYFLAALNAALSVVALAFQVEVLLRLGMGLPAMAEAAIFAFLGFFTYRRSQAALIVAMALYTLDGVVTLISAVENSHGNPPVGGIVMRVIFLSAMWKGLQGMRELNASAQAKAA